MIGILWARAATTSSLRWATVSVPIRYEETLRYSLPSGWRNSLNGSIRITAVLDVICSMGDW